MHENDQDRPKARLAVDWNGLEDAQMMLSAGREMDLGLQYFLDRETGKVVSLMDSAFMAAAGEEPEPDSFTGDLPDEEQVELARRIVADRSRYLDVPVVDETRDEYRDMEVFIESEVESPHLAEVLAVAIRGRGAFRRFKDVLGDYPEERERWFAFSHRRSRQRLLDWLDEEGIEPANPPEAAQLRAVPTPARRFTEYFQRNASRPDRQAIEHEWIERVIREPVNEVKQEDGRIRRWAPIEEAGGRYLRVVLLEDGETVHNAFFDRRFRESDDES